MRFSMRRRERVMRARERCAICAQRAQRHARVYATLDAARRARQRVVTFDAAVLRL